MMMYDDTLLTSVAVDSECGYEVRQQQLWCLQSVLSQLGLPSSPEYEGGDGLQWWDEQLRELFI